MQALMTFLGNHPALSTATLLVLILVIIMEWIKAKRNIFNLSATKVVQLINHDNAAVIDIRPKEAYQNGHILNAQSFSYAEIIKEPKKLDKYRAKPIVIVAKQAQESQKIAALLLKNGYNAYSLSGGIAAWTEAQMPLVKD
jgi:rhodanese-related sulfurtransferase